MERKEIIAKKIHEVEKGYDQNGNVFWKVRMDYQERIDHENCTVVLMDAEYQTLRNTGKISL